MYFLTLQLIHNAVSAALTDAFDNGIVAPKQDNSPNFNVTSKSISDIPIADITARKLTGIEFTYVELQAIESVEVTGTVSVAI